MPNENGESAAGASAVGANSQASVNAGAGDLAHLRKKRGNLKHSVTALQKIVETFRNQTELSTKDRLKLESRVQAVKENFAQFNSVQEVIEMIVDDTVIDDEYEYRASFEEAYFDVIAAIREMLLPAENPAKGSAATGASDTSVTSPVVQSIRLPTIELPKFNGNHEDWLGFRDRFVDMIHDNANLPESQKLHYLKACLQGTASDVIQSLQVSGSNYTIAWELLCKQYDQSEALVRSHVKLLFALPTVTKETSQQLRALRDGIIKHSRSLKSLKQPIEQWDKIFIIFLSDKLDVRSLQMWEESRAASTAEAKLDDLLGFLQKRCNLLETVESRNPPPTPKPPVNRSMPRQTFVAANSQGTNCYHCNGLHWLRFCDTFLQLTPQQREARAKVLKLCINCLRPGHVVTRCSAGPCRRCGLRHNSLLHEYQELVQGATPASSETNAVVSGCAAANSEVLLCTAKVIVVSPDGTSRICRALLDSGSQVNFASENLVKALELQCYRSTTTVTGIGASSTGSRKECRLRVSSCTGEFAIDVSCSVVPQITGNLPTVSFARHLVKIPHSLSLADPDFNKSAPVDLLLGNAEFWNIVRHESVKFEAIHFQNSLFGWLIAGRVPLVSGASAVCNLALSDEQCQEQLQQFWEIEDVSPCKPSNTTDACDHFEKTHTRTLEGRFMVRIPFTDNVGELRTESSALMARRRLLDVERRFEKNPEFKVKYTEFMRDYLSLGHMSPVARELCKYFIPHHGVISPNKLRVVFDGSMNPGDGPALNQVQHIGPKLQNDLFVVVLRFRCHRVVVVADIPHMYRQILVHPDDRCYQAILWRESISDEVRAYVLNTVTYGTSSAPYLAIECLRHVASENQQWFPRAADVVLRDFYVDDVLTGGETAADVISLCDELKALLSLAGFGLHKWASNSEEVLRHVTDRAEDPVGVCDQGNTKTLGVQWNQVTDLFSFKLDLPPLRTLTKRRILSEISMLFDPLGLVGPLVITAKIMLQELWHFRLQWDDPIPQAFATKYLRFREDMEHVSEIQVPRYVFADTPCHIQLHGFSDASAKAYGACIYVRSVSENGNVQTRLLCAKSRVSPIKKTTIPRLELCGALELAKLMKVVTQSIQIQCTQHFWCDSQVVLCWLRMEPLLLTTFVSNRVQEIRDLTPPAAWSYVNTTENPADLISRGAPLRQLRQSRLWWDGPDWLCGAADPTSHPKCEVILDDLELPEVRTHRAHVATAAIERDWFPFERFSTFGRVQRVMAYILRFAYNSRSSEKKVGNLMCEELESATLQLVRLAQREDFFSELQALQKSRPLSPKSNILSLAPLIDRDGVLRVGGRLRHTAFDYEKKHPALLSSRHPLSTLLARAEHQRLLHAGPQQTLFSLREKFWVTSGRTLVRRIVKQCLTCARFNANSFSTIMADLPMDRVTQMHPFYAMGVDFAGPFQIKEKRGRGAKDTKVYICLFVCLATKCLHLEAVTTLSADGFIEVLRRFISRRGYPRKIYSDNGRNFVGAKRKLDELHGFLRQSQSELEQFGAPLGIQWQFIPPYSPHFGGLWEAGVKSTKTHLKRIINCSSLIYEEFVTVIVQVEAVLNSRPMYPASNDPNDLTALTPAHFIIGRWASSHNVVARM